MSKTFQFTSNLENLTEQGHSSTISGAWLGSNGNPAGCMKVWVPFGTSSGVATRDEYEIWVQTPLSQTWEDWGVTAGLSVTGVVLESYDRYYTENLLATAVGGEGETPVAELTEILEIDIVDSSGTSIFSTVLCSGGARGPTPYLTWTTVTVDTTGNVDPAYYASTTEVRLQIKYRFILKDATWYTNPLIPPVDPQIHYDNIKLKFLSAGTGDEPPPPDEEEEDGSPWDDIITPPPITDWDTVPEEPPPLEQSTLGTYNLDIFVNHRRLGSRESEKITRVNKSLVTDVHQMMKTVEATALLLPDRLVAEDAIVMDCIRQLQQLRAQFIWRIRNAV